MSYDPRLASRPHGTSNEKEGETRKGSVRAAREQLQAAQRQRQQPDRSRIIGLPQRPNQLVSQSVSPSQQKRPEPNLVVPESRRNEDPSSPTLPWPLPSDADDAAASEPAQFPRPPNRGPPPRRPPRPVSEDLPIQPTSPDDYRSPYGDDLLSPISAAPSSRPLTTSSVASGASSLGSIPDFPVPVPPMPVIQPLPRRQPTLGPPPSARRGPSSYYTQASYVSPIAEESSESRPETIRSHHGSFASSNVFPRNDGDYYESEDVDSEDDDTITSDYGRDHNDSSELVQPTLVRQASLGRRTKPSLMTIKSVDSLGERRTPSVKRKPVTEGDNVDGTTAIGNALLAAREGIAGRGAQSVGLGSGSVLLDASSSSEESLNTMKRGRVEVGYVDPEKDDSFLSSVHPQQGSKQATLADRVGKRRPPRIDVDAVRDAESRGSLTSLPELIRRATRLAANLDRGRTASRLGLDMWEAGGPEKGTRRSGSLSDMLAAFPPPGEATPTGNRTPNRQAISKWPGKGADFGERDSASSQISKRRRRCCGMPMWTFVTLLIVLLFLIAAAVVIPVVLIVLPKMRNSQGNSPQNTGGGNNNGNLPAVPAPTSGVDQCEGLVTCQNGGVAIFTAERTCSCVCINGFTGKVCETQGDNGCITANVDGAAENATLGSRLPRLFEAARTNFSIPLDAPLLLRLFSDNALTCNMENALVTFNGLAARSIADLGTLLEPSKSLPILESPHVDEDTNVEPRQAIGEPGIATATPTSAQQNATPTPTPRTPVSRNTTAIDFARIGVLLLLQETRSINDVAQAQGKIQDFLSNDARRDGEGDAAVSLGAFEMDLRALSIAFQNGTTLQARPATNSTTS